MVRDNAMSIQIWSEGGHHWFFDTMLGVQVGEAWREGNVWKVQAAGDKSGTAKDFKDVIRVFLDLYRRRNVIMGPGSGGNGQSARGFRVRWIGDPVEDDAPKQRPRGRKKR